MEPNQARFKMFDQSELDELYDDFLTLDGNLFMDLNVDTNLLDHEFSESESESDSRFNKIDSDEKYSLFKNNNFISDATDCLKDLTLDEADLNVQLQLLNQKSDKANGNYLDKNGKIQNRCSDGDYNSLKANDGRPTRPTSLFTKTKENEVDTELKEVDEKTPGSPPVASPDVLLANDAAFHRNNWGPESLGFWHSGPSSLAYGQSSNNNHVRQDLSGVTSFSSSVGSGSQSLDYLSSSRRAYSHQQLGAKVEMVYSLISMLGTADREDMSKTLLAMSSSEEKCQSLRQSGCLPLLVQLIHSPELDLEVRGRASKALQNIVNAQSDDRRRKRESSVLKRLQQIREYCNELKIIITHQDPTVQDDPEKHPIAAITVLMKWSFDEEHRFAMCHLGGLHAIAELIELDHEVHGSKNDHPLCITIRRFAAMSLTNLTFADAKNKALLCSVNKCMKALVAQLQSPSEELRQVTASVFRNLSWKADSESKQILRDVGAVTALMVAAMKGEKESTLKAILAALWNLSAHCSMNQVDVCSVPGALAFLVTMLKYKTTTNTSSIIENAGGILRNISSHIAVREEYRQILRDNNCFEILLEQLKSPSLTVVSNACGTLWNLSARNSEDQRRLWEMGATSMLRSLVQSKHKMIATGSSAALKNLLSANPGGSMLTHMDSTARGLNLQSLPSLFVRKQKALEQELDITLSETCDNIEPMGSPTHSDNVRSRSEEKKYNTPNRSDSRESLTSTHSDSVYERVNQLVVKKEAKILEGKNLTLHGSLNENQTGRKMEEQKLMRRYKTSMIPTPAFKKLHQEKKNERTKEENQSDGEPSTLKDATDSAKGKKNLEPKEKPELKRGIPVLKSRAKPKQELQGHGSRYDQCYSRNDCSTQEEEDYTFHYSLKYSEPEPEAYMDKPEKKKVDNSKNDLKDKKNYAEYADYAETDLDQPTDFSLKYAEETSSDEDIKNQSADYYYEREKSKETGYYNGQSEPEDTTRTYYTEGTPYDGTPYNFSSANSMSDLRIDPSEARESSNASFNDEKGDRKPSISDNGNASASNGQKHYDDNRKDYQSHAKRFSREFESGISTPERPVQYCEEGTPGGCFSRVSSLSSLSGGKESSTKNSPEKSEKKPEVKDPKKSSSKTSESDETTQNKVVTFGVIEHYACADQTPLMFSRCSSMNSLSSFEQINHSIPDDGSSVVSDFSRMPSGFVSPSELPDSPTQTVPPSPKRCKPPVCFPPNKPDPAQQKKSVFEDAVSFFKQEDTPIEFSRATSLSSLNLDVSTKSESINSSAVRADDSKGKDSNVSLEKTHSDELKEQIVPEKLEPERERLFSVTEDEENMSADCINTGMQEPRCRPRQGHPERSTQSECDNYSNASTADALTRQSSGIPIKSRSKYLNESEKVYSYEGFQDSIHPYHREGATANPHGYSDWNTLAPEDDSDDGSACSDSGSMLVEAIHLALPKAKPRKGKGRLPMGLSLNKKLADNGKVSADAYQRNQVCGEYVRRKDHLPNAKDETSTFATENSPCVFSIRSSLSDLTVNSVDSPICLSRPEANREQSGHVLLPGQNNSQPSSSSISLIEPEDGAKTSEENRRVFITPRCCEGDAKFWDGKSSYSGASNASFTCLVESSQTSAAYSENMVTALSRNDSLSSSVESFDSCEGQALLEECIHSAYPHKHHSKKVEGKNYEAMEASLALPALSASPDERCVPGSDLLPTEKDHSKNVYISSAVVKEKRTAAGDKNAKTVAGNQKSTTTDFGQGIASRTTIISDSAENKENEETTMKTSVEIKQEENMNGSFSGHTWSEDYTSPNLSENSIATPSGSDRIEGLKVISEGSDNSKKKEEKIVPNFKIGSEISDPKFLQTEASKICREIRKYQELDMASSITSEVSLVSYGSFLDSNEFSLFDVANDTVDFECHENPSLSKASLKIKNFPIARKLYSNLGEPVSLPSLGSLRHDPIDGIDLESSIISVASITSEIAETSGREKEDFSLKGDDLKNDETIGNTIDTATAILDKGEETLNADTLGSDTEIFDDENSIHSQENLPLDSESSKESTPKRINRKLTPKEKRKTIQDRYRTYTIHDLKGNMVPEEADNVEKQPRKMTPKQRRLNDRERFLTRILCKEDTVCSAGADGTGSNVGVEENEKSDDEETQSIDLSSVSSMTNSFNKKKTCIPKFRSSKLSKNSRKLEKDRYRTRTLSVESKSLNDLVSVGPDERRELLDNAKLVAICLKTAALDGDSEISLISDSETENSHKTLPIDTATYNKNYNEDIDYRPSEDEYQSLDSYIVKDDDEEFDKKGPKISKPGERPREERAEATGKAVRGRRRQLYSSPLKKPLQKTVNSTPSSPKITAQTSSPKKYALATTKSLPNVPKTIPKGPDTPVLCREGTFTKEEGSAFGKVPKNVTSIPVLNKKVDVKSPNTNTRPAIRNKSAPILRNNKPVNDYLRNTRPVSSYSAKTLGDGNPSHKRHSSAGSTASPANRSAGITVSNVKRHSSSSTSFSMKNSASNQSIKSTGSAKSVSSTKTRVTASPKSQSNVSLDSISSAEKGAVKGKPKTPKKEVTSKIASLWKKVEESKKKDKNLKDNRVWITAEKEEKPTEEMLVIEKEEILELSSGKIVRSSTFQGLADGVQCTENSNQDDSRLKTCRNSGDFTSAKWEGSKSTVYDGRNVISAIVPPYNYNPPSSVRLAASPTIKQVDTFHKSSMKVTTV